MPWKDHLDKMGIAGSFIAGACCLGKVTRITQDRPRNRSVGATKVAG
jgi:hypothetical protein